MPGRASRLAGVFGAVVALDVSECECRFACGDPARGHVQRDAASVPWPRICAAVSPSCRRGSGRMSDAAAATTTTANLLDRMCASSL